MAADNNSGDALIGQTIADRYRVISKLGVGGMGVAYRAWDEQRGVPVVIKIPKKTFLEDPKFAERFQREIRLLQGLSHPHIVPIVDVGEHDGLPYVVMRFLPGGSLSNRRLRDENGGPRPNPPGMLQLWLPAVAAALDFVHASGVIHRDVKPANIFFDAFWGTYLGDFGIAKIVEESDAFDKEHTLTASQMLIGTQDYMAPEQFTPKTALDGRVDQYALAVIVYEMVSGSRPFVGKKAHLIVEVTTQPAPPLKSRQWRLPPSLVDAVQRGLAKKPAERFATCSEFVTAVLTDVPAMRDELGVARLLCPQCSNVLKLPTAAAGQKGKCPKCQAQMKVAEDLGSLWLLDEAKKKGGAVAGGSDAPSSGGSSAIPASFTLLSKTTWITHTFRWPLATRKAMIVGGVLTLGLILLLLWRGVSSSVLLASKLLTPATAAQAKTKLQLAEEALLENPLNPTANEIVARYWCCEQQDWARGLPYLAKSGLVSVSSTARDEIAVHDSPSPDSGDLVRIAQRWWKLAKQKASTNDDSAQAIQKHAVELFNANVGGVADAQDEAFVTDWLEGDGEFRLLVANKRPEIRESLPGTVATDPKAPVPAPESRVTLSPLGFSITTPNSQERPEVAVSGSPKDVVALPSLRNSIGIEFKLIPAGTFQMGSSDGEPNEKPVHEVRITKPFYLGVTEVTNAQWKAVMGDVPSKWKDDQRPVESMSWQSAVEFCSRLSALREEQVAGRAYRLPTEAEWEYACRAGTKTRWCCGDDEASLSEYAWFLLNANHQTHPVGQKKPNPWGLYDMHGNIRELTDDRLRSYSDAQEMNPQGAPAGVDRVHRGGSWGDSPKSCASASRFWHPQMLPWAPYLGFRLALSLSGPTTLDSGTGSKPSEERREQSISEFAAETSPLPTSFEDLAAKKPDEILAIPPLKNCVGIELKLLPAGTFQMGPKQTVGVGSRDQPNGLISGSDLPRAPVDPLGGRQSQPFNQPRHRVVITKPFYLSITEVTNAQWKAVMGDVPSRWKDDNRPVEQVTWDEAVKFCEKLSAEPAETTAGRLYRLPTEAEWEYACRAGTTSTFSFGNEANLLDGFAWFNGNAKTQTHPVAQKKPNRWGLYDMHGNVLEWCSDWFEPYREHATKDPAGAATGSLRIFRGGSWSHGHEECHSAGRGAKAPSDQWSRRNDLGFRVALSPCASDLSDHSAAKTETSPSNPKDDVQERDKTRLSVAVPPAIDSLLEGREPGQRERLVKAHGGGDATESAVNRAIDWLVRQQGTDGLWSLQGPYVDGATQENRLAATAMSLLALQGAGNTPREGRHKGPVATAWTTLLKKQVAGPEGGSDAERRKAGAGRFEISLQDPPARQALYSHAMVTVALCEVYGMTKDPAYEEPARQALAYAVAAQGPNGGWRYEPGQEGDMSVTGWYMMALKCAQMAGLEVPQEALTGLERFLDGVAVDGGSRYGYRFEKVAQPGGGANPKLTRTTAGPVTDAVSAEGLLCRQYLGWPRTHPALTAGVDALLKEKFLGWDTNKDVYAWYYISQVTHHMGGAAWEKWNSRMKEVLPTTQVDKGNEIGSWDPALDKWGPHGGRLFTTCFCTYMLEVYYRHLPLYGDLQLAKPKDEDIKDVLKISLNRLDYREREIVKLRYGLEDGYTYTDEEIAQIFQINTDEVRSIVKSIGTKLGRELPDVPRGVHPDLEQRRD